jgi:hypothetical protein
MEAVRDCTRINLKTGMILQQATKGAENQMLVIKVQPEAEKQGLKVMSKNALKAWWPPQLRNSCDAPSLAS